MHPSVALVLAVAVGGLAACSPAEIPQPAPTGASTAARPIAPPSVPATADARSAQAVEIKSASNGLDFDYAWPAEAAAIPELDAWLRDNAAKIRAGEETSAKADRASAAKDGFPYRTHSYEEKYAVVTDLPRLLILQSEGYVYTGGAHGFPINTVIIWDKAAKRRLATTALLDIAAFRRLANDRFCAELDRQRVEKRGEPVKRDDPNQIDGFTSCSDLTKQIVLPISKGSKALDTLRILILPYEAGPYAEGTYTIELPFDAKTLAAVKPAWRSVFAAN